MGTNCMSKKAFSVILALLLFSAAVPLTGFTMAFAATSGVFVYQKIQNNTAVAIINCNEELASGALTIPATIEGLPVIKIEGVAFSLCYKLTHVTIPDSVTSIGSSAFSDCYSLKSITIPNSVTTMGDGVFYDCAHDR